MGEALVVVAKFSISRQIEDLDVLKGATIKALSDGANGECMAP